MNRVILGLIAVLIGIASTGIATTQELRDADFSYQLRGYCLAGSEIEDTRAPGGFYADPNMPRSLDSHEFAQDDVFLRAFPGEATDFAEEYQGMKVRLINGTNKRQAFSASDSRIAIVQEAKDADGEWKPIEYLPSSWCGNSYHTVFLGKRQYWEFDAPRYSGSMQTMLRFKLTLDDGRTMYSNEFHGSVNPAQFAVKQGHTPTDIMDPYVD